MFIISLLHKDSDFLSESSSLSWVWLLAVISSGEIHHLWWMLRSKAVLSRCAGQQQQSAQTAPPRWWLICSCSLWLCPPKPRDSSMPQPAPPSPLQGWSSVHSPFSAPVSSIRSVFASTRPPCFLHVWEKPYQVHSDILRALETYTHLGESFRRDKVKC